MLHSFLQGANERSFKLLQEYLSAAEERRGNGGAASVPYKFLFFVKPPSAHGVEPLAPEKVTLTLPPPVSCHALH